MFGKGIKVSGEGEESLIKPMNCKLLRRERDFDVILHSKVATGNKKVHFKG